MNVDTGNTGAEEVSTAVVTQDPKGDAEAYAKSKAAPEADANALADQANAELAKAEAAEKEKQEKVRSNTTEYIQRIKAENREMRRQLAEASANQRDPQTRTQQNQPQQRAGDGPPTLEDCDFDVVVWQQKSLDWTLDQVTKRTTQAESTRKQLDAQAAYDDRVEEFKESHPDFLEAVQSIDPRFLSQELEAAVTGHEKGPAIAYHLATNEDALWNLASIRPDLIPAAIDRLASRLDAAPVQQEQPPATQIAPTTPTKPISQAPPPVPKVAGRATANPSPEKMTDDDWYKADRESRRKR